MQEKTTGHPWNPCNHESFCMQSAGLLVSTKFRVGTNSGMDYWNGILDWTTGLSYFPFLDMFLNSFLEAYFL